MSLLSVIQRIGKGVKDVGQWIDEGIKVAEPIVAIIDPEIVPILLAADAVIQALEGRTVPPITVGAAVGSIRLTAEQVQSIVTAAATLHAFGATVVLQDGSKVPTA